MSTTSSVLEEAIQRLATKSKMRSLIVEMLKKPFYGSTNLVDDYLKRRGLEALASEEGHRLILAQDRQTQAA
jgi:hypothetical protein